jgi:hypothetical protein
MKKQALDYKQTTINGKSCNALTLQLIKRHPNNKEMIQSAVSLRFSTTGTQLRRTTASP